MSGGRRWRDRLGLRGRARRGALGGMTLALVAGGVGLAAADEGSPPATVDLQAGGAWVASSRVGLLTLIDGETAEVAARVDVGDASPALLATQSGPVGYAVDGDAGSVVRVDPRTFETSAPVVGIAQASGRVSAHATATDLYLIDDARGRVVVTDPDDPRAEDEGGDDGGADDGGADDSDGDSGGSLAEAVGSSVVDRDGRLWLLGESSGDLVWFEDGERHDRSAIVSDPAGAELVAVDGSPVLVDPAGRVVRRIGGDGALGARACVDVDAGDETVRFGGSHDDLVYAVSGEQGVLRVSDLGSGECSDVAIPLFDPGDELGAPVEARGRVFVPNFTTGTVAVVDVDDERVVVTDEPVAEGTFELFDRDGIVFYNDPDSEQAGVIHVDGSVSATEKYDPANPDAGLDNREPEPEEERAEQAEDEPEPEDPEVAAPPPPGADPGTPPPGAGEPPPDEPGDGGTRPAGPGEPPDPPPGATTTTTDGGSTGTTRPRSSTTTTTTTTTTTPQPTTPACTGGDPDGDGILDSCDPDDDGDGVPDESDRCPGGSDGSDVDGDGIPDACDPDDDNDGVPDGNDRCPGGNDRNDQDGDGIPNACDGTDNTGPSVNIDSVTRGMDGFFTVIRITVSANDPYSGIGSLSYTLQTDQYSCNDGSVWDGVTGSDTFSGGSPHTFTFYVPCDAANGRPSHITFFITANATNGDGIAGSGFSGTYDP